MRLRLVPLAITLSFTLTVFVSVMFTSPRAFTAVLNGIQIPDALQVGGKTLHLNGFGRRTYSILAIHIYLASLYLEHVSTNADEIIHSPETKYLVVEFEDDVNRAQARNSWRTSLENNCVAP
jgi:hypothetical protein